MKMKSKMVVVSVASLLTGLSAMAADPSGRILSAKRQMVLCMTKRMSDSKSISYNEATKVCKEELQAQQSTLTSSVLAKPLTGLTP